MTSYWVDAIGWDGQICGIYIKYIEGSKYGAICEVCQGMKTNNELEYYAVLSALELAKDGDIIYSDSQLVVNQIAGTYKLKAENLREFYDKIIYLLKEKKVTIQWVPREENVAGIVVEMERKRWKEEGNANKS